MGILREESELSVTHKYLWEGSLRIGSFYWKVSALIQQRLDGVKGCRLSLAGSICRCAEVEAYG